MAFEPWVFNKARLGDTKTEVTFAEFFNTLDFNKQEEYLVRESFQNSGDAALSDLQPVVVRIFVSGAERALPTEKAVKYFGSMQAHLDACQDISGDWVGIFAGPCEYLAIEDFGTKGLTGDESAGIHDSEQNHFYHFFRTAGRTDKQVGTGKAGSWGVGKFVYIMSSQIRTMFGYTARGHESPTRQRLLLGQAALRFHQIKKEIFVNYGYFGIESDPELGVTMPYSDDALLRQFASDWNLKRVGETGLSVVVPYCKDIDPEGLLYSIIKEYGGRILRNRLVVELDFPNQSPLHLSKDTVLTIVKEKENYGEWREVQSLLLLLKDHEESVAADWIEFPIITSACDWKDLIIPDEILNLFVTRMRSDGTVFVRVPLEIQSEAKKDKSSKSRSFFEVLLRQEEGSEPIAPVYFRDGLRISGKQMGNKSNGVRTVFISGDGILAEMLTNAEGPAHTEWQPNRDKFKGKYHRGDVWLRFCKNAPRKLVELARGNSAENDYQSLADLFPDPEYEAASTTKPRVKTRGESGGGNTGEVIVEQEGTIPVRIRAISRGFSLSFEESTKVAEIEIEMAYARARGSSFSKWNPADFQASELEVTVTQGQIKSSAKNKFVVSVKNSEKFRLQVQGFDERRDLRVRATKARDE